jgi:hypothetical protein
MKPVTADDWVTAQFKMEGNVIGELRTSVVTLDKSVHRFAVYGSKASLVLDGTKLYLYTGGEGGTRDGKQEVCNFINF